MELGTKGEHTVKIEFVDRILDNVHGFIPYTEAEGKIIDTLLFKRLQSIKQLSVANWIFPGSEHTRFIHSLGVMHIADRIALQIGLAPAERKIVRLAGLLHDIGHFPLSHVCEVPYKKDLEDYDAAKYCKAVNSAVIGRISSLSAKDIDQEFMKYSTHGHHEAVGAEIIKNSPEIRRIISEECGESAINIICDIIVGKVTRTDPLLVQILHSELDADGIDYLLRDALFSGTSFGSFELDQLINSMEKVEYGDVRILAINPKGIAAADQYLINKFFSYSQIVFNKHICILEWMASQIVDWMQKHGAYFPKKSELLNEWITDQDGKHPSFEKYLSFTDNYFWSSLQRIVDNPLQSSLPKFIVVFCNKLLQHSELPFVEGKEARIISRDPEEIKKTLEDSEVYREMASWENKFVLMEKRSISKHVPYQVLVDSVKAKLAEQNKPGEEPTDPEDEEYLENILKCRLMEGICVNDNTGLHLLCDDARSLMRQLYGTELVVLRAFEFPD